MVSIGDWSTRPATHCPLGTHFDSVVDELDLKGGGAGSLWQGYMGLRNMRTVDPQGTTSS